jgi:predicted RNA-binding protein with TRAM domain
VPAASGPDPRATTSSHAARRRIAQRVAAPKVTVADNAAPTGPIGELVELEVGQVAHGGSCVARADGRVVFVRHALPGETPAGIGTGAPTRSRSANRRRTG